MSTERVVELETRLAFQEQSLQELSDIVYRQQRELEQLRDVVRAMEERLKAVEPSPLGEGAEPPPPHY